MSGEYFIVDGRSFETVDRVPYDGDEDGPRAYELAHILSARADERSGGAYHYVLQVEDI